MKDIWRLFQILSAMAVIGVFLFSAWSWAVTGEQRRIEGALSQNSNVEALQFSYYEGSTLDLHIWTETNGYLLGAGFSAEEISLGGRGGIAQIGDLRVSCVDKENLNSETISIDSDFASLYEIGAFVRGDPYFSLLQLIDDYDEVYGKFLSQLTSSSESLTYSVSVEDYLRIYPKANIRAGRLSFDFVCRSKRVTGFEKAPLKPGVRIHSPAVWFSRKPEL